ncbi:MAG TPA: helix-turn-helix transcriptional regulator [Kofleriaceae bacterium]|jgi:transcriptional regulator with XRE-family HTH domain
MPTTKDSATRAGQTEGMDSNGSPTTTASGTIAASVDGATIVSIDDETNALGVYLRDRRSKLDPTAFGFSAARRRTPGLRREEVAQRANVSATWYTWLEQGRGGAPSLDALERIAAALALSDAERDHLFFLALGHGPEARGVDSTTEITPQLQRVLDANANPSIIATSTWDIVGWNRAAVKLFGDYDKMPAKERNTLRLMFSPGARERRVDWEHHARGVVAAFRAETARLGTSERATRLVDELSRSSPEFAAMWNDRDVAALGPGQTRIERDGETLLLDYSSFGVNGQPDLHMIVYTPATAQDDERLRSLLERSR